MSCRRILGQGAAAQRLDKRQLLGGHRAAGSCDGLTADTASSAPPSKPTARRGTQLVEIKFTFDSLLSAAGDKIQFTFDDPDYAEGNDFEEDFIPGFIQCQQQCLAR